MRDLRTEWPAQSDDLRSSARSLDELLRLQRQQPISGLGQSRRKVGAERSFTETPPVAKLATATKVQPCFDIAETVRLQPREREQSGPKCNCSPLQWSAVCDHCDGCVTTETRNIATRPRLEMLRQAANRS